MKILYISDRGAGGIANHVKCLTSCLPPEVERYAIGIDEPFAGKNGHDLREWFQIRRTVKRFKPDVVHFHAPCLLMALYVRLFSRAKVVCSWHMPTNHPCGRADRIFFSILGKDCYFLPVSSATWEGLKKWLPYAKGEVFFNPVKVSTFESLKVPKLDGFEGSVGQDAIVFAARKGEGRDGWKVGGLGGFEDPSQPPTLNPQPFVIGMVGRNADQKDWPSFHKVEELVKAKWAKMMCSFLNAGEKELCDGRAAIAQMDLFVMTSKHEELPTVVLECFAIGTPICGFLPDGGTSDILSFSKGPVDAAFLRERSCEKLAELVIELLRSPEKRRKIVEDGREILEGHFDAEKNCRGQLMRAYGK